MTLSIIIIRLIENNIYQLEEGTKFHRHSYSYPFCVKLNTQLKLIRKFKLKVCLLFKHET